MMLCVAACAILRIVVLSAPVAAQKGILPITSYNITVLKGGGGGGGGDDCPSVDQQNWTMANILGDINEVLHKNVLCNCGGPGWTRIAHLNMTDPNQNCPGSWKLITSPKRSCGRASTNSSGCNSATFNAQGLQYSQVCGKVVGYQVGDPDAFGSGTESDIESYYVEGVSITHGNPRGHIWTLAAAYDEVRTDRNICPCTNANASSIVYDQVPTFIGEDYFCETGVPPGVSADPSGDTFYTDDPLWDGEGCGPKSNCCTFNNPPWFCKQLPQATGDDVEVRICAATQPIKTEDTPVEFLEIYVR